STTASSHCALAMIGAAASRMSFSRSLTVNKAALLGLEPTPTTSLSHTAAACSMTSRWPLVIGSNEPEKKPTRVIIKRYPGQEAPTSRLASPSLPRVAVESDTGFGLNRGQTPHA